MIIQEWRNKQADLIAKFCVWYERKRQHNSAAYPVDLTEAEWGRLFIQFLVEEKH